MSRGSKRAREQRARKRTTPRPPRDDIERLKALADELFPDRYEEIARAWAVTKDRKP